MTFFDIAKPMAERGVPQIRTRPQSKAAFDKDWPSMATTDLQKLAALSEELPNCNAASVAAGQLNGFWMLEVDSAGAVKRIEAETGQKIPATFRVRSRPGRGHFYWKNTPAALAMGNISQTYVKEADWSARVSNQYVVSAGSVHPISGIPYTVVEDSPIAEAPDWLVAWLVSQKIEKKAGVGEEIERDKNGLIAHGFIHGFLLREAGRLRALGLSSEAIYPALSEIAHKNCAPPLDETKIKTMSVSICNFPEGRPTELLFTQASQTAVSLAPPPEIDTNPAATRPTFPLWTLRGTSIYENLVAPAIATSSKHAEFIAMPAIQIFLNYLSGHITVGMRRSNLNLFVGLVSPYGEFFKSTSCILAQEYFNFIGMLVSVGRDTKNAENKVAVMQAGSPEGLGLMAQRIQAKHGILFNDELGKFVSKAGIDSSAFSSDLLSWYGSAQFGNNTTNPKNAFNFAAGDYCFSWLWNTTDRGFNRHWPRLSGISSGLEDRMFFVVSPEQPKPAAPYHDPAYQMTAVRTRQLADRAINQGKFEFDSPEIFAQKVKGLDPRSIDLAQKLAVYFSIDLGLANIDDECIERSVALVEYRNQAAAFLAPIEADSKEGRLQKEITRELQQNRGKVSYRTLCLNLDYKRYGTYEWARSYTGLLKSGDICEFFEERTLGKRATRMVGLVKQEDE